MTMPRIALVLMLLGCVAAAQESSAPASEQPSPTGQRRILRMIPTFDVTSADAPYRPLTAKRKFTLMANQVVDRSTLLKSAVRAAFGQATDNPKYGQGWDAYGARVGASVGDTTFYSLFGDAVFPIVFKQDPRYFRLGRGTGGQRAGYALSRVLVTRADSGAKQANVSNWFGAMAGAGMSNAYYPERDRTVGKTFARAGESLAIDAGINLLKEFWPDVWSKLKKKKQP